MPVHQSTTNAKFSFDNPRPLPDSYPLVSPSDIDLAFSTASGELHDGGAYLSYYDGQCDLVDQKWQRRADGLFFKGGALEEFGIAPKPDTDASQLYRTLRWLLSSWSPKQEQKSATVGFVLSLHCDELPKSEAL